MLINIKIIRRTCFVVAPILLSKLPSDFRKACFVFGHNLANLRNIGILRIFWILIQIYVVSGYMQKNDLTSELRNYLGQ